MKHIEMDNGIEFLAEYPSISVLFAIGVISMSFFDDLSVYIKILSGTGAFIVVCLTIYAKLLEIQLTKKKLRNEEENSSVD